MKEMYLLKIILFSIISLQIYAQPNYEFPLFASGLNSPVGLAHADDDRLFIVQQVGTIVILDQDGNKFDGNFLNITNRVQSGGERGLLGMAFHPDYANNGYLYVHYSRSGDGTSIISRFSVSDDDPNIALADSEFILMTINQPYANHNGGAINFGNDGYLYIGMGDGGSGGDPDNYSQNRMTRLGKMLRIDVDNGNPYSIPADNPFVDDDNTLSEIYALGLRNPWRFTFDSFNGDLWIADVGQNKWEEVNHQIGGTPGGQNYGWRCYEGFEPYNTNGCGDVSEYVMPAAVYGRASDGGCSISGGEVYRGNKMASLYGKYIYSDYCSDNIWVVSRNDEGNYEDYILTKSGQVFGTVGIFSDVNEDLYLVHLSGRIHKIVSDECDDSTPLDIVPFESAICAGDTIAIQPIRNTVEQPTYTLFKDGELIYTGTDSVLYIFDHGEYLLVENVAECTREIVIFIELKGDSNAFFDGLPEEVDINDDILVMVPQVDGGTFSGNGVVNNTFDPQLAGMGEHVVRYTVTENDLCTSFSERTIEVLNSTNVNPWVKEFVLKIKPNPVIGNNLFIEIQSSNQSDFEIEILNLSGVVVLQQSMNYSGKHVINYILDIASLNTGFYIIRVYNEAGQTVEKLIRK